MNETTNDKPTHAVAGRLDGIVINTSDYIGDFIDKQCPKCGSNLLGNKVGDEWCSFVGCNYGCGEMNKRLGL